MVALALGVEAAFIQRASGLVAVRLAAEVAGQFPGDDGLRARGEGIIEDAAGVFVFVGADFVVFVEAHVIDKHRDNVSLACSEVRKREGLVLQREGGVAGEGAEEGLVEPSGDGESSAALGLQVEGGFGTDGSEMPAEEEVAGVEAVVGAVERSWCGEVMNSVVAICEGGWEPCGVGVVGENFGEAVDVFPREVI